jgi:hypothetical protein
MVHRIIATGYTVDDLIRETQKIEQGIPTNLPCYLCKRKDGQESALMVTEDVDANINAGSFKIVSRRIVLTPFTLITSKIKVTVMLCMECRALLEALKQKEM